jgi:hypothetical protein
MTKLRWIDGVGEDLSRVKERWIVAKYRELWSKILREALAR